MFVNAINGFRVNSYNGIRSLKDNENENQPAKSEEQPVQEEAPKAQNAYYMDMINFGERNNKTKKIAAGLALLAALGGATVSCQKDDCDDCNGSNSSSSSSSSSSSTSSSTAISNDYTGDARDTVYHIEHDTIYYPGDTVRDTIVVPGDTVYVPGDTIRDTVYMPGDTVYVPVTDTLVLPGTHDTVYIPEHDTIWMREGFTSSIFDTIRIIGEDLDVEYDGDGVPVRLTGYNQYDQLFHDLQFKQDFSNSSKVSYIDHSFEAIGENIDADGLPIQYIYRRFDISEADGRCYVEVFEPRAGIHTLPAANEGRGGWRPVAQFYLTNKTTVNNPNVLFQEFDRTTKAKFDKQGQAGTHHVCKAVYDNNGNYAWQTVVRDVKMHKANLNASNAKADNKLHRRRTYYY